MKKHIIISIKMLILMTVLTGLLYPLFITFVSQIVFPKQSNGSLIKINGKVIGSQLIAQKFTSDKYFWSRPSSIDYNPLPSGASNFGMTNKTLYDSAFNRKNAFILNNELYSKDVIPTEMLFASASGVDPDISVNSAFLQVKRISKARNISEQTIEDLIRKMEQNRQFYFLGEERINVLMLNLELDKLSN